MGIVTNRNTLYGYKNTNGMIACDTSEKLIVAMIFDKYINEGCSFANIAAYLNERNVIYSEYRPEWDKNKIARIIGDERYTGGNGYPTLIAPSVFEKATHIRSTKQARDNMIDADSISPKKAIGSIVCGECGEKMWKRHDKRYTIEDHWYCKNEECGTVVAIANADLADRVLFMANKLIRNGGSRPIGVDDINTWSESDADADSEARGLDAEVMRLLDSIDPEKEKIKCLIYECASAKYRGLSCEEAKTGLMMASLIKAGLTTALSRDVLNKAMKEIRLYKEGAIEILLINGWTITEDTEYGNEDTDGMGVRTYNTA